MGEEVLDKLVYREGDTEPSISGSYPADLSGATISLHMRREDESVIIKSGLILASTPSTSLIQFTWDASDLVAGINWAELHVVYPGGGVETTEDFEIFVERRVANK